MKVLVGYDGSIPADGALYDLQSAGLPAGTEALVLTAAVPWGDYGPAYGPAPLPVPENPAEARKTRDEARLTAERGAVFLESRFPAWNVRADSVLDDPAHGLLARAEAWGADLIDLGTPDRSALSRILRGSVTRTVLRHAHTGVRVARPRLAGRHLPPLLLLALDGSPSSEQALRAILARSWPPGTQVRVVGVLERATPKSDFEIRLGWIERKLEAASSVLSGAGLIATPSVLAGNPRKAILAEAKDWCASAIFVGARGLNPSRRKTLGKVAAAIAAHAPCTVEVAFPPYSRRISATTFKERPAPKRKSIRQA